MQKIIGVAIKVKGGAVTSMLKPMRHHDVIKFMADTGYPIPIQGQQGFILENGQFIDRKTAATVALVNGQVEYLMSPPLLYSEDLW